MSPVPPRPKIYHISHGKNLASILSDGCFWSDAEMIQRGGPDTAIGLSGIKQRRLTELSVSCHPGTKVGEFVPFYFCPRSLMLFIIHCRNHPELTYRGGQRPILHFEADLHETISWANDQGRPWAFTNRNAGSRYFKSFRHLDELGQLNWDHIMSEDFREAAIKDAKQAEFLVHGSFPWRLVRSIGVMDEGIAERVLEILAGADHQPHVRVERTWYY